MVEKEIALKDIYQKALAAYTQAMKAFHKGDYQRASALLEAFLEMFPSEKELVDRAEIYLSICKSRLEKKTIPLRTFEDCYQQGVYQLNQGNYEDALKLLEKTLEMRPNEGKVYYLSALAYCLLDQEDPCLENLKKAIQLDKYFKILAQNEVGFGSYWENKKFKLIIKLG